MKKKYVKPTIKIFEVEPDIIASSGKEKPGHGWGDGGHTGPPGHKKDYEGYDFIEGDIQ